MVLYFLYSHNKNLPCLKIVTSKNHLVNNYQRFKMHFKLISKHFQFLIKVLSLRCVLSTHI